RCGAGETGAPDLAVAALDDRIGCQKRGGNRKGDEQRVEGWPAGDGRRRLAPPRVEGEENGPKRAESADGEEEWLGGEKCAARFGAEARRDAQRRGKPCNRIAACFGQRDRRTEEISAGRDMAHLPGNAGDKGNQRADFQRFNKARCNVRVAIKTRG